MNVRRDPRPGYIEEPDAETNGTSLRFFLIYPDYPRPGFCDRRSPLYRWDGRGRWRYPRNRVKHVGTFCRSCSDAEAICG